MTKCQAHDLKVVGSNPTPTNNKYFVLSNITASYLRWLFCVLNYYRVHRRFLKRFNVRLWQALRLACRKSIY